MSFFLFTDRKIFSIQSTLAEHNKQEKGREARAAQKKNIVKRRSVIKVNNTGTLF